LEWSPAPTKNKQVTVCALCPTTAGMFSSCTRQRAGTSEPGISEARLLAHKPTAKKPPLHASCTLEYSVHMCLAVNIHDGKCPCQHRHARRNIRIVHKNKKDSESIVTSTLLFSKHLVWSSCIHILGATTFSYKSWKLQKFGERTPEVLECTNLWGAHTRTICMNSIVIHTLS